MSCEFCEEDICLQIEVSGIPDPVVAVTYASPNFKGWYTHTGLPGLYEGVWQIRLPKLQPCGYACPGLLARTIILNGDITTTPTSDFELNCQPGRVVRDEPSYVSQSGGSLVVGCNGDAFNLPGLFGNVGQPGEWEIRYASRFADAFIPFPNCLPGCRWPEIPVVEYTGAILTQLRLYTFTTRMSYVEC